MCLIRSVLCGKSYQWYINLDIYRLSGVLTGYVLNLWCEVLLFRVKLTCEKTPGEGRVCH